MTKVKRPHNPRIFMCCNDCGKRCLYSEYTIRKLHKPYHCNKCKYKYRKVTRYWLGRHHSKETIEKIKEARSMQVPLWKGRKRSKKYKESVSKQLKKLWRNPEYREKMSEAHKHYSPETIKKIMTHRIPNKEEIFLDEILQSNFPGEWKYVGDGKFTLAGKNPDFININGKKAIIELFGEPWHEKEEEQIRTDLFSKYGYSTLIIWSSELRKKLFIKKIRKWLDNLK